MTFDMNEIFAQLQRQMSEVRARPMSVPQVEATGSSDDGLVEVSMAAGEVTAVAIDARAMRLSNAELADKVREAVNASIADHTAKLTQAVSDLDTDFGALSRSLDDIRDQTSSKMQAYLSGMEEMLGRAAAQKEQNGS